MPTHPALSPQLHLITGKGGVGRTSVAISLAQVFALRGEQVLVLEARDEEGGGSALGRALGVGEELPSASNPRRLSASVLKASTPVARHDLLTRGGALYAGQLIAREGHERFLSSLLPVERLVKSAVQSQGLGRFLNAAPSMYELGLFYHLWSVVEGGRFTKVVMDLPATGHTLALTRLPGQIERMVPIGPVTDALRRGRQVICDPREASMWIVAIPEQLPVSEALDLRTALQEDGIEVAAFVLNRAPFGSSQLTDINEALKALKGAPQGGALSALYTQLERARALPRLSEELSARAPVFSLLESSDASDRVEGTFAWLERGPQRPTEVTAQREVEAVVPLQQEDAVKRALSASATEARTALKEALLSREVIVCCGAGGVGKTTTSAALALAAAQLGREVLVLTIDPSKRLAQALGVSKNTPTPVKLSEARLATLGVSVGSLSAWLLDPQLVSDGVVQREASAQASALMSNLIYKEISGMVAGMQEYTAVEALRSFVLDQAYDLVVLDTPPARHALRFLDAPERVAGFLDKRIFKLFVPDRSGLVGRLAGRVIDEVLERAFGAQLKHELKQFFELFSKILDHLNGNQQEMKAFFRSPNISFYLVTAAHAEVLGEARYFSEQVKSRGLSFGGVVLNRDPLPSEPQSRDQVQASLEALSERAEGLSKALSDLYEHESTRLAGLDQELAQLSDMSSLIRVPDLGQQASQLEGLASLARALSGHEGDEGGRGAGDDKP